MFNLVRSEVGGILGIGELYIYDTSMRLGAYLGFLPTKVYLHAGTRKGAKALGFTNSDALEISELPTEFGRLDPHEVEDVLCIFKDELKKLDLQFNKNEAIKRSWCG